MNILNSTHVIAQASRCYKGGGGTPERDLYEETSGELRAKLDLAPRMLAAEAEYRPLYQALEMQNLQDLLMGNEAGTRTFDYTEMVPTGGQSQRGGTPVFGGYGPYGIGSAPGGRVLHPSLMKPGAGGGNGVNYRPELRTRTVNIPGSRGLLDLLEHDIMPASDRMSSESLTRQREAEIGDVERLGPRATAAWRAANPEQAKLLDELNRQAQSELELGAQLDPSMRREVEQQIRAGQAARGMGLGMNDLADEIFGTGMAAEDMRARRRGFATQMTGVNQMTSIDPFMATLGRPGMGTSQGNQLLGQSRSMLGGIGPQLFGSSIDANDVYNTNFNAAAANQLSAQNNQGAMVGAGIGAGGALAGGLIIAL
jgi:hypothetical protein